MKIGSTQIDGALYAQSRDILGVPTIGARVEALHRFTQTMSGGVGVFAEKEIGGQSRPDFGAQVFGRWSFP